MRRGTFQDGLGEPGREGQGKRLGGPAAPSFSNGHAASPLTPGRGAVRPPWPPKSEDGEHGLPGCYGDRSPQRARLSTNALLSDLKGECSVGPSEEEGHVLVRRRTCTTPRRALSVPPGPGGMEGTAEMCKSSLSCGHRAGC